MQILLSRKSSLLNGKIKASCSTHLPFRDSDASKSLLPMSIVVSFKLRFLLLKFRQCGHHSEQFKHYFGPLTFTKLRQTWVFRACFPKFLLIQRCGVFIDNFRNHMKLFCSTVAEMIVAIFSPANWILCFPSPCILRTLYCSQSQIKDVLAPKLL